MALAEMVAWASLRRRPARTLFSVLGVAIGIAVVVAIAVVDRTTIQHARPDRTEGWRADLEVRAAPGVLDPAKELAAIAGVSGFTEVLQSDGLVQAGGPEGAPQGGGAGARFLGLEPSAFRMGLLTLTAGSPLSAGPGDDPSTALEVLLGETLAQRLGVVPGDRIWLSPPPRPVRRDCVDGRIVERAPEGTGPPAVAFVLVGVIAPEGAGRIAGGELVVLPIQAARTVLRGGFLPTSFWVARDERVPVAEVQERLVSNFAVDLRRGAVVGQQADEIAFRNGVRLAGLLSLALGLYVIFHTLSMGLVERAREMATLEALGASRGQIGRIVFAEALVIAAAAGGVGLGLGLLLAKGMLEAGMSSLGLTDFVRGQFEVPWNEVLPLVAMGVVIALLGSVAPLLRARRTSAVPLLRGEDPGPRRGVARGVQVATLVLLLAVLPLAYFATAPLVGGAERELVGLVILGLGVLGLLIGAPVLVPGPVGKAAQWLAEPLRRMSPFSGLLAARSISLSPTRISACAASVALVTAAFVGLRGMTASLALETETWVERAVSNKLWVYRLGGVPWTPLADSLRDKGVAVAVEPLDARLSAPFRIVGLPPSELNRVGPLASDPELAARFAAGPALLVSRRLASQRNLAVGDRVAVATPSSGVVPFEVIAIADEYGYVNWPHERAYAVANSTHMGRLFCLETEVSDSMALHLAPGVDDLQAAEVVKQVLREAGRDPSGVDFALAGDIASHERNDILRDFLVFDVILALALALAGTGVLNGLLLSAMERAKELGVLRALGADFGQIGRSVLIESAFVGLSGGVLGLLLGAGLVPVVVAALRVLSGLDLPQPGWQWIYLMGPLLAVFISVLGGLYPLWRMGRADPVRAVRTG